MPLLTRYSQLLVALVLCVFSATATEYHGRVTFGGLPLPGATLTASQGDKKFVAATGLDGMYSFPNLPDGDWHIELEMLCFATVKKDVTIAFGVPTAQWEMTLLSAEQIKAATVTPAPVVASASSGTATVSMATPAATTPAPAAPAAATPAAAAKPGAKTTAKKGKTPAVAPVNTASGFQRADVNASATPPPASEAAGAAPSAEQTQNASDSFAINGSVNNGAASPFGTSGAFGNNRRGPGSLYNGAFQLVADNSVLDAAPYSINGQNIPKASQNRLNFGISEGGPLRIPHLINPNSAPTFFIAYQLIRNRNASTQTATMPTAAQRAGDFTQNILDPTNGTPFPGNVIPQTRISPQAIALLNYYPLPSLGSTSQYNYESAIRNKTAQDSLQARLNKNVNRSNQVSGSFSYQNTRNQNETLFGFLDKSYVQGYAINGTWQHRFTQRLFTTYKVDFSRQSTDQNPYFENRVNVSGLAGITGNNQNPLYWGPPSLGFGASNIAGLSDGQEASNHNQTAALGMTGFFIRSPHNFTFGADVKRQQFNSLSQSNPRGSFSFNGAASGYDFADFLLGVPDTSSIAYGNADKYFRSNLYDAYMTDDWRLTPGLTLNIGMRWEYNSPITEKYNRLVNLDIRPGFTSEAPVLGTSPTGSLTGVSYPGSLIRPDKTGFQPRIGIAWRPISGSSLVVRAGYGINYDTSVYQAIASRMAQQSPLSKSFSVANSAADPLTLANGFNASPLSVPNTFAVDPNFRVGYAHSWQLSIQRDLPGSLVLNASYLGIKGTRGIQVFLPNTYPAGVANPCAACLAGYAYMTSNGNSTNEKGNVQLRRRLHNGITATVVYTYSKAIDDASLGGRGTGTSVIAQNWLDLSAERGLSPFDQRHVVNFNMQYTTGVGVRGGMLLDGWRGTAFKEWTISTAITAGSGTPESPQYAATVAGTGVTGPIRPEYTGQSIYAAPAGLFLNPAAFTAPPAGQWGNAGRNSIEGPGQFSLNASMNRTFRIRDRYNMDIRLDTNNALNHVTYTSWITTITSQQFGLPAGANGMRTVQATLRMRF